MALMSALRLRALPSVGRLSSRASARVPLAQRSLSTAMQPEVDEDTAWEAAFLAATEEVVSNTTHADSAQRLRGLLQTGLLRHTDLRDNPERFFKAHRLLARHAVAHGPGFWIRFTVHYNLVSTRAHRSVMHLPRGCRRYRCPVPTSP